MSDWTREELTEQILKDLRGLVAHFDAQEVQSPEWLMTTARQGCVAFLRDGMDTHDLITLASLMCRLIREHTLASPEGRRKPDRPS